MNYETGFAREIGDATPYVEAGAPKRSRLIMIVALLLIAAVAGAAYYFFTREPAVPAGSTAPGAKAAGKSAEESPRVTVVVPGRQTVENIVTATGTLAARRDMPVGAVGEGGLVQRVLVEPGNWVRQGQVLVVIDRQVQVQQNNQLAAQIAAAQADASLAQAEYERSAALIARGFISKADVQRKAAARDAARARVRVAEAQLAENRARVGRLDVRAPASGLVLTRAVEPGQVVGAGGGVLFRIAQGGEMELRAQLSEADLARMAVGYRATVTPVGTTAAFGGQIWQLSPVIDPQSRQGTVRIALPYNEALRPGGFASTKIVSGSIEAPMLPESAVQSDGDGNYVYIVGAGNKAERRAVKVGTVTDVGVSILEGLSGTEQVVLSAGGFLNPGEVVIPDRKVAAR